MAGPEDDGGATDRTLTDVTAAQGVEAEPEGLQPGQVVAGRFEIVAPLGKGGMGVVYRAHQKSVDRPAALKVLHKQYARDGELVRRFEREARAASRIVHPNGVVIFDFGRDASGLCFLAMELVEGTSLRQALRAAKRFPAARAVRVVDQILSYLEELHAAGIVHRDLKPDNVFLLEDKGDRVKVIDFGLAKITDTNADELTRGGTIFGTAFYMSPEQAVGDPVDARADLYSVGIVLYELLAGRPPFTGGKATQIIARHVAAEVPHPHQINPKADLPPGLWEAMQKLLGKLPRERPSSAAEARALLAPFLAPAADAPAATPPAAPPATPATPPAEAADQVEAEDTDADADADAGHADPDDAAPVAAPPGLLHGDALGAALDGVYEALVEVLGPMADFVLRDALAAVGAGLTGPPEEMTRDQLARAVALAADSVPAARREGFVARALGSG